MADKVHYNKLIRDKIPEKMDSVGAAYETRTLSEEEFEQALLRKVEEEASALPVATSREELIEELADVMDVIDEIKRLKSITNEEMTTAQIKTTGKKGGFKKRLFLLWSANDGYKTNENRNG
ncbi:MAG: nucleoside triphosphate pyrophosphohydrolase [Minisyncoccia bacterium]